MFHLIGEKGIWKYRIKYGIRESEKELKSLKKNI